MLTEVRAILTRQVQLANKEKRYSRDGYVFINKRKTGRITNIQRAWATATKAAGCPDVWFHSYRKSAITNMALAGIPEKVARQISGHRSRNVYDAYQCYEFGNVVEEAKKLDGLIEQMDNKIEKSKQVASKTASNQRGS